MHKNGILKRQYWANRKMKNCENIKEKNKEADKTNQTKLKGPGRSNVAGDRKYKQSSEYGKRSARSKCSKLAPEAT